MEKDYISKEEADASVEDMEQFNKFIESQED
jgi:hypothetical protein